MQDTNTEASKDLSGLEREAKELNLTSEQLHRQLDILKNSNFLGKTYMFESGVVSKFQIFDV